MDSAWSGHVTETATSWSVRVPIAKLDTEQRRAFGWASVITDDAGDHFHDHQGTLIPTHELEEAAYEYVQKSRDAGVMHAQTGIGNLITSVVMTPEVRKAMDLPEGKIGWFVGFQVTDDAVWKRIKSGELSEFSIGGSAIKDVVAV